MLKLALIGKDISHSLSPSIYQDLLKIDFKYDLLDYTSESQIPSLSELQKEYYGINITSPYKETFISQLDINTSPLDIVNVLKFDKGSIVASNTDYLAAKDILNEILSSKKVSQIAILGDGSMAKMFLFLLSSMKLSYQQFSRKLNNLDQIDLAFGKSPKELLILNTCARNYNFNTTLSGVTFWDMNYNHEKNAQVVLAQNGDYKDGLGLLKLQAKYALSFWNLTNN